ncbi:polynucleotide kinase-phosphatase [Treponema sp. OMZ 792]|uniref:polynucleotide kinase-phosphatase n=1 Tax=unclassified Treponema TaxID=2638727 RepID=UPI0020A4CB29|nr:MULTISPECIES: polynucleotide kinase-phosphatase [unclassified Treponema]UTC74488.1 polynucleotide kinase-phosphatase [Treponema sp. OMZ 792]UTC80884.1 polynucleotide kinase-phosphatase [Treponema sp. OMZ 798]
MQINIPKTSLVLLVGVSGSGKSSFAQKHFEKYEIISSDVCRGIVSNDENNQSATNDAFEVFNFILSKRLQNGLLTVADATNIQQEARKKLLDIARSFHILPVAIVFDLPQELCEKRNEARTDRNISTRVLRRHMQDLKHSLKNLKKEGFKKLYILRSEEEVNSVTEIVREKLYNDKTDMHGPFDIIGDVHGCYDELLELLQKLNYKIDSAADDGKNYGLQVSHPENRMAVFLGDLVDRGPASPKVLKLVMSMVRNGSALCVPGNHDMKLHKKLNGKAVQEKHGLAETLAQLETESEEFKNDLKEFLYGLVSHYVLDSGKLVVAHAGLKEEMHGRGSGAVRSFCLYGETTGETDEFGLPVRYNWASEYRGRAKVVYGHTPVPASEWLNNTIDIDTGCVFGGTLTALRYPEEELVSVRAKKIYTEPVRPIEPKLSFSLQHENDDLLDIEDVTGRRIIQTRLKNNILIREEQSIAALEAVSRFAVNPKWLIYLPPTMSPSETSRLENFLEHPIEAIDYYKSRGLKKIILEEKHMGSRAVLIICKDIQTAEKRFGITTEGFGICYTRTGRNFFNDSKIEKEFLTKVQRALTLSNFWEKHSTNWVCLDAELMPWSVKAQSLIHDQYAATGSSAINSLSEAEKILTLTKMRGVEGVENLSAAFTQKKIAVEKFIDSYRNYCWEVKSIDDYQLAPFHILATEDFVHTDKNHEWHMENIKEICLADKTLFKITPYKIVNVENEDEIKDAVNWWLSLTRAGGEGMVIKPFDFVFYAEKHGLVQPGVKCRGKEYLRIIYGPEYCEKENLDRLKKRGLAKKRALALQEFALGIEALERFVKKEPLRRVHESAFAVLALESEAVDPRL